MRIAFFGGSFDPPHRGHLAIARAAIERLALDTVWMAPVGVQPLKPGGFSTSFADRLAMVELAAAGDPRILPSTIDAPRSDGQPNYTIDVLTAIKASLTSGDELYFLLGADAFLSLKQWHGVEQLPFLAGFIVAGRPGFSVEDLPEALPASIRAEREPPGNSPAGVVTWSLQNSERSAIPPLSNARPARRHLRNPHPLRARRRRVGRRRLVSRRAALHSRKRLVSLRPHIIPDWRSSFTARYDGV